MMILHSYSSRMRTRVLESVWFLRMRFSISKIFPKNMGGQIEPYVPCYLDSYHAPMVASAAIQESYGNGIEHLYPVYILMSVLP